MYSKLTDVQREQIRVNMLHHSENCCHDVGHAAACAANSILCLSNKAWNGKKGADAFAAALAVGFMKKVFVAELVTTI